MGRSVKVRISFQADIAFLTRLIRAVELDSKIQAVKKKTLITSITDAQITLMEIDRDRLSR